MFLFNKVEVYMGFSMDDLLKVRNALSSEGIEYKYKVQSRSDQWYVCGGTRRGVWGSGGMNMAYEKQYIVLVKKPDYPKAKYIVNKALHS